MGLWLDNGRAYYDQLSSYLEKDKASALEDVTEDGLEELERFYERQNDKLTYIRALYQIGPNRQRKFMELMDYFNQHPDISLSRKLDCTLTYACLLGTLTVELNDIEVAEAMLLSAGMNRLPVYDYNMVGPVLANQELLQMIVNKTDIFWEQLAILNELFDYCNDCLENDMDAVHREKAIDDCKKIVSAYIVKAKAKGSEL